MKRSNILRTVLLSFVLFFVSCGDVKTSESYELIDGDGSEGAGFRLIFFKASPSWGDAPFSTSLQWSIEKNDPDIILSCTIDINGDGFVDHDFEICPLTGSQPYEFVEPGKYEPQITVRGSNRKMIKVTTELFSNMIEYFDYTRFPHEEPGFLFSEVFETSVTLHFSEGYSLPQYFPGDILMGMDGFGYLRKVISVAEEGSRLNIKTDPAKLDEAIKAAKFGVKDEPLMIRMIECIENCDDFPDSPPMALKGKYEVELSERLSYPLSFKKFIDAIDHEETLLEIGFSATYYLHIDEIPFIEFPVGLREFSMSIDQYANFSTELEIVRRFEKSFSAGRLLIGTVPVGPVIFTLGFEPEVKFEAEFRALFKAGFYLNSNASMTYRNGKIESNVLTNTSPDLSFEMDTSFNLTGEMKVSLIPSFDIMLFDMIGPVVRPTPYIRAQGDYDVYAFLLCLYAGAGADIEFAGRIDLFRIFSYEVSHSFNLAEWEFFNECYELWGENDGEDEVSDEDIKEKPDDSYEKPDGDPEPCVPKCSGKECGDDGCGGVCGTCEEGKHCSAKSKCVCDCDNIECLNAYYDGHSVEGIADGWGPDPTDECYTGISVNVTDVYYDQVGFSDGKCQYSVKASFNVTNSTGCCFIMVAMGNKKDLGRGGYIAWHGTESGSFEAVVPYYMAEEAQQSFSFKYYIWSYSDDMAATSKSSSGFVHENAVDLQCRTD